MDAMSQNKVSKQTNPQPHSVSYKRNNFNHRHPYLLQLCIV